MKKEEFIKKIRNSIELKKEEYELVPAGSYIRYKKIDGTYNGGGIVIVNKCNKNPRFENLEKDDYLFIIKGFGAEILTWSIRYSDIEDLYKDTCRISMIEINRLKNNRSMSLNHISSVGMLENSSLLKEKLNKIDKLDKELDTIGEFAKRTNKKIELLTKENKELEKELKNLMSKFETLERKLEKRK